MMSINEWKDRTSKAFHGRTGLLKRVDETLDSYNKRSGSLADLEKALNNWKSSKADWTASIRNKADKHHATGAVQDLTDQIGAAKIGRVQAVGVPQMNVAARDLAVGLGVQFTRRQQATQESRAYSAVITQKLHGWNWNAAGTALEDNGSVNNYQWTTKMRLTETGPILTVTVIIQYRAKPGPTGTTPSSDQLAAWKRIICGAWNGATLDVNPPAARKRRLDIQFDIYWIAWGGADSAKSFKVNATNLVAPQPPPNSNWRTRQDYAQMTLDGRTMGTPHMEEWGVNDRQAIIHEFGHVIGLPDEYGVTEWTVDGSTMAIDGATYDQPPFKTDSIMNDTRRAVIYERHYFLVKKFYLGFYNSKYPGSGLLLSHLTINR